MKKVLSVLLTAAILLSVFAIIPMSVSADDSRYFDYRVIGDDQAEITGYTGISSFIDIPSELNGLTVTSIGDWAFNGYSRMTELTIPDTITNIGEGAFWECKGLTEVFIPESVTSISDSAFYDCTSLTSFKVDGNNPSYRSINGDLYDKSAETLIQYASGKTATSFTIPDSVVTIKEGAFIFSCLTEVTVPKYVMDIEDYAIGYKYDDKLMPEPIDGFVIKGFARTMAKQYATDNDITFVALERDPNSDYEYTVLDDGTAEITKYKGDGGDIEIPPTLGGYFVTSIAFGGPFVTSINEGAFYQCSSLTKVFISDSITTIGYGAFANCNSLTSVIIPESAKRIHSYAFSGCSNLTELNIPDSVTYIGGHAFNGCHSLTELNIPDSVTYIGDHAFGGCSNITEVAIPDSVTTIQDGSFGGCNKLAKVSIPTSVTIIGDWAFSGCSNLTEVSIPTSVTSIGDSAFYACSSLTEVSIPASVTTIGECAFSDCSNLSEVSIPASVKSIGYEAFGYIIEFPENNLKIDDFTIMGYPGTAAEKYANDNGFNFIALEIEPEPEVILLGDVDGDGEISSNDPTFLLRLLVEYNVPEEVQDCKMNGDIDGNKKLEAPDATFLQRFLVNYNVPYQIGKPIV